MSASILLLVAALGRSPSSALATPGAPQGKTSPFASAVQRLCPTAPGAAQLERAASILLFDLIRTGRRELAQKTRLDEELLQLELSFRPARLAFDGFPVEWEGDLFQADVCLRAQAERPKGGARHTPPGQTVTSVAVRRCEPRKRPRFTAVVRAQVQLDCEGNNAAMVVQSPSDLAHMPRVGRDAIPVAPPLWGPSDVWLNLHLTPEAATVSGGCFPGWRAELRQASGLAQDAQMVWTECSPLYVKDPETGRISPWFFSKPRKRTVSP